MGQELGTYYLVLAVKTVAKGTITKKRGGRGIGKSHRRIKGPEKNQS